MRRYALVIRMIVRKAQSSDDYRLWVNQKMAGIPSHSNIDSIGMLIDELIDLGWKYAISEAY